MSEYLCFMVSLFLFLLVIFNESQAGELPPPETIGAVVFR